MTAVQSSLTRRGVCDDEPFLALKSQWQNSTRITRMRRINADQLSATLGAIGVIRVLLTLLVLAYLMPLALKNRTEVTLPIRGGFIQTLHFNLIHPCA